MMLLKSLEASRRSPRPPFIAVALVAASATVYVGCDEVEEFVPAARYEPDVLDFGEVSVATEKTLDLTVRSVGSAGLSVVDALVDGASDKFTVVIPEEVATGLAPGQTSTIAVTYRPCPDAWTGNSLKEDFDFNQCPGAPDANDLSITDNTPDGSARIPISGQPVQPPVATIYCPMGPPTMTCGDDDPTLIECNGISFGTVNGGEEPCDLVIEVRNEWRENKQVGDLSIDNIEVLVRELNTGRQVDARSAGFAILDENEQPLAVDSGNPFVVEIEDGGTRGTKRFKLRFSGEQTGLFRGEEATMTGLRLYTNDPDNGILTAPLTAIGSAPDLTILIDNIINYGPVEQGNTKTATRTFNNFGDATLTIDDMRVESGNPEFAFSTSKGETFPITLQPNESMIVTIAYTPVDTGTDIEKLIITSNDPEEPTPDFIELRGGAVPTIEVEPADVLVFALPQPTPPPPLPPRTQCLTISNTGFGNLIINELEMVGPGGERDHPAVDDFTIDGIPACSANNPCDPGINLCPPTDMACENSTYELCFTYDNNDISTTDQVSLIIRSNDPANPDYTVVLQASDVPCFFPTPIITVETERPCVGQPVRLNATASDPGGDASGSTTISLYDWSFAFAQPPTPIFMPADMENTLFIPERGGLYIINLELENSCGARSQGAAQEQIIVAATGCN